MKKKLLSLLFIGSLILALSCSTETRTENKFLLGCSTIFAVSTAATTNFWFRNHRLKGNIAAACVIGGLNHLIYKQQPKFVWAGYGVGAIGGMSGRKTIDLTCRFFHWLVTGL